MNVTVFGLGYVGSVTMAGLAQLGHDVTGVDIDAVKVKTIAAGKGPIDEPGLDDTLAAMLATGRLRVSQDVGSAIRDADVVMIAVGTPTGVDGRPELRAVWRCAEGILAALEPGRRPLTVVIRSTVPPGTTARLTERARELGIGAERVGFVMHPEFLREGSALDDFFRPEIVVVGGEAPEHRRNVLELYRGLEQITPFEMTDVDAEIMKLACNAFHALKITFANEIGRLAAGVGADANAVMKAVIADTKLNVSARYLRPGFAFGGSCLPKDLRALEWLAQSEEIELPLVESLIPSNDRHIEFHAERLLALRPKSIAILGLAFKENTDDPRETPVVPLIQALDAAGVTVRVYDAHIAPERLTGAAREYLDQAWPEWRSRLAHSMKEATDGADVVVRTNPDRAYAEIGSSTGRVVDLFQLRAAETMPAQPE